MSKSDGYTRTETGFTLNRRNEFSIWPKHVESKIRVHHDVDRVYAEHGFKANGVRLDHANQKSCGYYGGDFFFAKLATQPVLSNTYHLT